MLTCFDYCTTSSLYMIFWSLRKSSDQSRIELFPRLYTWSVVSEGINNSSWPVPHKRRISRLEASLQGGSTYYAIRLTQDPVAAPVFEIKASL